MAILPVSLTLPSKPHLYTLSYNRLSSAADNLSLSFSSLSLQNPNNARTTKPFTVRMGGGPRTYPGGVSKWQWKRMQKKKATQLLKARLMRERQIYEMRKRAELKAAVSELERPWEVVEQAAPNLFSVGADEQLKVLADRFQKPGGFDLWTEKDGPQLFETPDGLPTSRFFPKGVVHSIKPYGRVNPDDDLGGIDDKIDDMGAKSWGSLNGGSNSGFDYDQESGHRFTQGRRDRNSSRRFSETEDSDEESSFSSNSRVFNGVNRRQSGPRNLDPKGTGNRHDRNLGGRFSETEYSHGDSSYSPNSRDFSGVNRRQSGQRNLDSNGSGNRRDRNLSGRFSETEHSHGKSKYSSNSRNFSGVNRRQIGQRNLDPRGSGSGRDRNLSGRFSETEDSHGKSSYSSNSRNFSGVNRRQIGQRNLDPRGSGSGRDRNLGGRFSETEDSHGESSHSSNSRVFSGGNRRQSDQRNLDKKGSGSRRDGDFRKIVNRKRGGSGGPNGAIKVPDWRQSTSSATERRNSSRTQIDGNNQYRRDSMLDKRRNSSHPEDVYDMSLQTDGSYSLGSS